MKDATRIKALARQAGGVFFTLAHGAVISIGLMGMGVVASEGARPLGLNYADTRVQARQAPTASEAAMAAVAEHAVVARQTAAVRHPVVQVAGRSTAARIWQALPTLDEDDGLSQEMARVRDWVADKYRVSADMLEPVLATAEESARDVGIDPLLIVAIMAVESSFNPKAQSNMGALGLMQVIPKYHKDKMGGKRGKNALFDPEFNVQVGIKVLHEGLQRYGTMQRALQYYNGALKDPQARYTRKVMSVKKRLRAAAGRESLVSNKAASPAG